MGAYPDVQAVQVNRGDCLTADRQPVDETGRTSAKLYFTGRLSLNAIGSLISHGITIVGIETIVLCSATRLCYSWNAHRPSSAISLQHAV